MRQPPRKTRGASTVFRVDQLRKVIRVTNMSDMTFVREREGTSCSVSR